MQTVAGGDFWKDFRDDMPLVRIPTANGAILYDPSRVDHPQPGDFEPAALAAAGRVQSTANGRGSVWFVAAPGGGSWVLRHYRRGGWAARVSADRYLWRGEEATRAFRELRLLARLESEGLAAARGVAARVERAGATYRADLLTVAVPGVTTLAARLAGGVPAPVWRALGATLRTFHDAGVDHADLNAHNVLVDALGRVTLIDFDRGRVRAPGPWRSANLARLARSLAKLGARPAGAAWAELMAGYEAR
jgi:3-deoxy-D-manno-octulosonic acid kinase